MAPLRIALVTRRFWPLAGGGERVMANLALELAARGHQLKIVTAQWDANWAEKLMYGPVPVFRLPQSDLPIWGTLRYMASLATWFGEELPKLDLVYVSMLKHDAFSTLGAAAGTRVPVILRPEGAGPTGDCRWQDDATFGWGIRSRCRTASAVVACSDAIAAELAAANYPVERTVRIDNGVPIPPPRDADEVSTIRAETRTSLSELDGAALLRDDDPLVVYTGRLHAGKGLVDLVTAWPAVLERWPTAQLWLIGEGPQRAELEKLIVDLALCPRVFLPGVFDDVGDVLAAADLYVLPSYEEGMSLSLLEAMAAGLPVIATDIPGNRPLVRCGEEGLLVPRGEARSLAKAIVSLLDNRPRARQLGQAARARVARDFSIARTADEHEALFARLLAR